MRSLPLTLTLTIASLATLSAQEAKPKLELRTTTGQTTFHIGERIPLTLTLTGPDNKKYSINTASYDRSGRLNIDTFTVTPTTGWTDPLAQYFSQGIFMGGGLFGSEPLSSKPATFPADLNEHIRFDQPGDYTITATSHRVGTAGKRDLHPKEPYLGIQSNPLQIHIIPATPEWQAEKLRSALAIIATPIKQKPWPELSPEQNAAIADLRYLNSPSSIEALAGYLREDSDNHLMFAAALGLAGVPDSQRDTAFHAMSRQLEDPGFRVSSFFLDIMAELEAAPGSNATELQRTQKARLTSAWQLALASLARKQGAALATTADALLTSIPNGWMLEPDAGGEATAMRDQVAATLVSAFTALPIDHQVAELQNNWDVLKHHPVLPLLAALLHQPTPPLEPGRSFYSAGDLNMLVLKRWSEIDPDGAARELTALLSTPGPVLDPLFLASLPGGPQPQFEPTWAQELLKTNDDKRETLLAALLVRFGTGAAASQVEAKLDSLVGKWACRPQAAALAYVVKFDTADAANLVHRAMASTQATHCYDSLFSNVSAFAHGPALNAEAVMALRNEDPRAAADAAQYLRSFGTPAAKQPLLERYRQWTEQWSGKSVDLDAANPAGYPQSAFGQYLGEALIANQGWLSDPKLIAEVLSRCIGESMCTNLQRLAAAASPAKPVVAVNRTGPVDEYQIGPYVSHTRDLFEAKIDQFPKGTVFTFGPYYPQPIDQQNFEREIQTLFVRHGMRLEPRTPASSSGTT